MWVGTLNFGGTEAYMVFSHCCFYQLLSERFWPVINLFPLNWPVFLPVIM